MTRVIDHQQAACLATTLAIANLLERFATDVLPFEVGRIAAKQTLTAAIDSPECIGENIIFLPLIFLPLIFLPSRITVR